MSFDCNEHYISKSELSFLESYLSVCGVKDSAGVARNLLARFYGLGSLYEADIRDISELGGDGAAMAVRLMVALNKRRVTSKVTQGKAYTGKQIESYIESLLFGAPLESVYLLCFDSANKLIHTELISEGTVNASVISSRRMLDIAVRRKAKSIVLAHNHPGGEAKPSDADVYMTSFSKQAFDAVGIEFKAHYVVAAGKIIDVMPYTKDSSMNYTDDSVEVANRIRRDF